MVQNRLAAVLMNFRRLPNTLLKNVQQLEEGVFEQKQNKQ